MFHMDGRSDDFDEIEDYLYWQWLESLSDEEQEAELERLRAELHDMRVRFHLGVGVDTAFVEFNEAMTEMYHSAADALNLSATVLTLSKVDASGECDQRTLAALDSLRDLAECGLPQAQKLASVACVVSAHAALERLLARLYGLLVLSRALACWFDDLTDKRTGLARHTMTVFREHARAAAGGFMAMADPMDTLAALAGVLGTEISLDEDLEAAWRAHRQLRTALVGGGAVCLAVDDVGRCGTDEPGESLAGILADPDLTFSASSVCEAVALVVTEAIERGLGIELLDDEMRRQEYELVEESREYWSLGLGI